MLFLYRLGCSPNKIVQFSTWSPWYWNTGEMTSRPELTFLEARNLEKWSFESSDFPSWLGLKKGQVWKTIPLVDKSVNILVRHFNQLQFKHFSIAQFLLFLYISFFKNIMSNLFHLQKLDVTEKTKIRLNGWKFPQHYAQAEYFCLNLLNQNYFKSLF